MGYPGSDLSQWEELTQKLSTHERLLAEHGRALEENRRAITAIQEALALVTSQYTTIGTQYQSLQEEVRTNFSRFFEEKEAQEKVIADYLATIQKQATEKVPQEVSRVLAQRSAWFGVAVGFGFLFLLFSISLALRWLK